MRVKTQKLLVILLLLLINGCATYRSDVTNGLTELQRGNLSKAQTSFERQLNKPNDRLLKTMELGLIHHLQGNFEQSNRLLHQAELQAEKLYTRKLGDLVAVSLTNPRAGPYRGNRFERVFIHYYKAMNYLGLAFQQSEKFQEKLDEAQVEARKVDVLLNAISHEVGRYGERGKGSSGFFGKVVNAFNKMTEGHYSADEIEYREDGYIRYITGLIYELGGELDDARIAYQKAAEIYEVGFAEQHHLGTQMAEQAWFDVIRMMQKSGGYEEEWPRLKEQKLSETLQDKLPEFQQPHGQLVVLHHQGMIASRGELNLDVYINPYLHELVIRPWKAGRTPARAAQFAWFQYVYADHGIYDMLRNYYSGGPFGTLEGIFSKKIVLKPVWNSITSVGADELLRRSLRVTVPYYTPPAPPVESLVEIDGVSSHPMALSQSLSSLAVQEQLLVARSELYEAIGRELLKRRLAYGVSKRADKDKQAILSFFADLATAATSAAETRNWLSLPSSIHIQRFALPAGSHQIRLIENDERLGEKTVATTQINMVEGQNQLITSRSFRKGATLRYYAHENIPKNGAGL